MRDVSSTKPSSEFATPVKSPAPAPAAVAPGKSTLVDRLRGLTATSTEHIAGPADAARKPATATRGAPASARSLDLIFGDPRRGLKVGPPKEREAIRGGDDDVAPSSELQAQPPQAQPQQAQQPAPQAPAVTISSTTNAGPTFGPQGAAMWHVAFTTTGRTGWIVQKIDNTVTGTDASGAPITPASIGLAPHYYEAWSVDAAGAVTPMVGGDNDHWDQGPMGASTKGTWSTTGELYWLAGAARPRGMSPGAVPNAGMLVSSYAAPPGLGSSLLHRFARATWDATVTPPVDTGAAGP